MIHNYPVIDFYRMIGGKLQVSSMKTTKVTDVQQWMYSNKKHLDKLNKIKDVVLEFDEAHKGHPQAFLHIFVPDKANYTSWVKSIQADYKNIKVKISTIEESI